jgi:hypothetical protein
MTLIIRIESANPITVGLSKIRFIVWLVASRFSGAIVPAQSIRQTFDLAVVVPPPPAAPTPTPPPTPEFDDATQTVLTALVQGSGDWTAWMKVRTQGTTLKLKPGDDFKIGLLSGTVVDVNSRFVTLEIDGKRFELRPAGNLAEAAKTAATP